ncbi:MAG: glycosyltransferase [Alphaproteobacteria bacterium]|nr:glycosyltransferase [Alphaproteobacteria bacterium]
MSPKVSVIVPVYNVAEYLGQCLDTILLQTLQDIEVICVDDGSTDDSLNILNMYAMFDERLKVIHQENAGLGPARNRGLKDATGEFIIFLDSDDFFHPEMLEKMVAKAEEDEADITICGYSLFDDKTGKDYWEDKIATKYITASPISPKNYPTDLFTICSPSIWTKLFRHSFLRKNNLSFINVYAEDVPFSYMAMALSNKISLLEECFCHYRQNRNGQITGNRHKKHGANIALPFTELYNNLSRLNLKEFFLKAYQNRFKKTLIWELRGRSPSEKREFLKQLVKKLPLEITESLFEYNTSQPKFSIVIAVYNASSFLKQCLNSCLNQTLREIEIIAVDDGSADNSLEILNEYAKQDKRVKILTQENQHQSIARYNAMKIATGEFVWYVDADDYLDEDSCECLYLYAKIHDLDMLSFACIDFQNDTGFEYEEPYHCLKWLPENFIPVFTWQNVCNIAPQLAVTAPLTIYRRKFLEINDIHWLHKKIVYEDTPFFTEAMLKNATMGAFPEKFYHKRIHELATTQNMDTNFSDYCWIIKHTLGLVQKLSNKTSVLNTFINSYLLKVYLNYQKLSSEAQKKMTGAFYKLCFNIVKKYHIPLSDELNNLCYDYLKTKSLKKRLGFFYFSLLARWSLSGYAIRPFNLVCKPELTFSVFGFSLLKFKRKSFSLFKKKIHYHPLKLDDTQLLSELKKLGEFTYMINSGNMGDMVIAAATIRWFNKKHLKWKLFKKTDFLPQNFVYGGGGGWTHTWIKGLKDVMNLMKNAKKIVILPSSFDNVPEFIEILDERFVVFCREKKSFDYLVSQKTKAKILLDHDMAFRLQGNVYKNEFAPSDRLEKLITPLRLKAEVLPCHVRLFRTDLESKGHYETDFDLSDSMGWFSPYETEENIDFVLNEMFSFLSHFQTIETDRLHVAIVSALLGKKVILSDNTYGKLEGVYRQTMYKIPNVKLLQK